MGVHLGRETSYTSAYEKGGNEGGGGGGGNLCAGDGGVLLGDSGFCTINPFRTNLKYQVFKNFVPGFKSWYLRNREQY